MVATTAIQPDTQDPPGAAVANCADGTGALTALFFSDELHDIATAKRLCATCPLMAECLEGALDRHEQWGVWGGQLFMHGKIVMSKRRRGRPPKLARPEDQLPVIPFPAHLRELERELQAV